MKKHFFNIYVHPITVIYIALALFLGRFSFFFIHLFMAFIHECFHMLTAAITHVEIDALHMLPFGFYAEMKKVEETSFFKQLCIYISGPLSIFFSLLWIRFMYQNQVLSFYGYKHAIEAAKIVCFFNLLPIFPLDGARILRLFSFRFFEEKIARRVLYCISFITTFICIILGIKQGQYVLLLFFISGQIKWVRSEERGYLHFLSRRLIEKRPTKIKISSTPSLFLSYDNYYLRNGELVGEKEIIAYKMKAYEERRMKRKNWVKVVRKFFLHPLTRQ